MKTSREIVTFHFGQAGIQMGNAIWETMITEHGILCNGKKDLSNNLSEQFHNSINTLFHNSPAGQYYPRSLIVDSEPMVIDEIRSGYYRNLFHPDFLISGIEDAANNFARGFYSIGKKMLSGLLDKVRYIVESCENFKGFVSYCGSAGGTGSGLFTLFLERLMLEYSGKLCIGSLVLPGQKLSDCIVEPYNTVLRISESMINSDINLLIDNESLYKICYERMEIHQPTYNNINRLLAPIFSSITAPFRFNGPASGDLSDLTTNLVPYPKINFPAISYAPFLAPTNIDHTLLTSDSITHHAFNYENSLLSIDIKKYKIMTTYLIYRGSNNKSDITRALDNMKKQDAFKWVDWCPTGFKVSQTAFPPISSFQVQPEKALLVLCNHSGIIKCLEHISKKFNILYRKKSFVHWYIGEGMEYDEMNGAKEAIEILNMCYRDACQIKRTAMYECEAIQEEGGETLTVSKLSTNVKEQQMSEVEKETEYAVEHISKKSLDLIRQSSIVNSKYEPNEIVKSSLTNKPQNIENNGEIIIDSISDVRQSTSSKKFRASNDFVFSDKAKEILMENLTSISPEMKQRMLGFTNIE